MNLQDELTNSVNPGDDYYNFVNKKWCDKHPIPKDKSQYSALTEISDAVTEQLHVLLKKQIKQNEPKLSVLAKQLYRSGMDTAALEKQGIMPVKPQIDAIEKINNIADVKALIIKRHSEGRPLLWQLAMDVDEKRSDRYVMVISQDGLLLPDRDYYMEKGEQFDVIRSKYKAFLAQAFEALGKNNVKKRAQNVYKIESKLAAASNTAVEDRDVEKLYNPFTFEQLAKEFSGFDWIAYQKETGLGKIDGLIVHQPKFITGVLAQLNSTNIDAWKDYLLAHSTIPYFTFLSKKYDELQFSFFGTVLTGATEQEDRFKRVIRRVQSLLPEPVGKLYVESHFDESAKATITDLVEHIKTALRVRIMQLDWMTEKTKQKALDKLDTFMPLLGYPDKWRTYDSLELNGSYFENYLAIKQFEWQYDIGRVKGKVNRKEWLMSPATVNAYYWPNTNGITFPAAILQPPAFDANGDFAANYGAIGMVIGHEIIHGFDDSGSKFDKTGNLKTWWTASDRKEFEKRIKPLENQFDGYVIDGQNVKGALTLGENIADLGGMQIAFDAMLNYLKESGKTAPIDGFTPEQRFFLAQARMWRTNIRPELQLQYLASDPHAPCHLRVNGVVTNLDAWYEAWKIPAICELYQPPEKRIRIW